MVAEKLKGGALGTGLYEVRIRSKWVSQTHRWSTPYDELPVQTHTSGLLWWQFTFTHSKSSIKKKKELPGHHPKKTECVLLISSRSARVDTLPALAAFVTYFRRQCDWFGVFKTVNKTGNAFQGRCLTLDKIKYTFKIILHSKRRNIGIFRQGRGESLIFTICIG